MALIPLNKSLVAPPQTYLRYLHGIISRRELSPGKLEGRVEMETWHLSHSCSFGVYDHSFILSFICSSVYHTMTEHN